MWPTVVALCALSAGASRAAAAGSATLDGLWTGRVQPGHARQAGDVTATLAATGSHATGTLTVTAAGGPTTFAVVGGTHRGRAHLSGLGGGSRLRWKARWSRKTGTWRGPLSMRGGGVNGHGVLVLARDNGPLPTCGTDYFTSEVMPTVLEAVCAQCHVPGGLAQNTAFRVTPGDPMATLRSAIRLVDPADPAQSRILLKPRGAVSHGGGQRLTPGSAADTVLQHWVDLVTAPGCGGAGGGPGATGDPWVDNCASCHGADARGTQTGPDIHCNRNIHDVVRAGRKGALGEMPAFPDLPEADIATIQTFLAGLCPITSVTGAELFAGNCASCHGADSTGTPDGPNVRCATRVADAVRVGRGAAMPSFDVLVDLEVTLLESYLDGLCTQSGRTGSDLWAGNCASCHGADGRGGQNALGVRGSDVHCNLGIHDPVRDGDGQMPAFPGLSDSDVAAVQQYLATAFCPAGTATGADLYTSNCATCHGADARGANGAPNIRCSRSIRDAVQMGRTGPSGTMPAFSAMSDANVALVQDYLIGLCPPGTASGSDLYAGNCESCHGTDAGGTSTAPSVRCSTLVTDALQRGRGTRMPSFPAFAGADVTNLETWLAERCAASGRTASDLYAGNCASCHGDTAGVSHNGLGEPGPDIRCTGLGDYQEKIPGGGDGMPAFPSFDAADVIAVFDFVTGTWCRGG